MTKPYPCIVKSFHFEGIKYQDVFNCLKNLRNELEKNGFSGEIAIEDISEYYQNIKNPIFREMIHYVFRNTKVRPCLLSKTKFHPTSKEEIQKILTEHHDSELAGHPGVTRTYQRIKERYY
ncbi:hypothetical protein RUM43_014752 [Polyplax serrata]|uniref:Integrase zinc-binding domain-containing protein n=1 Tax=Polyplax serrata TaxID=468196 RepID=A0AAN8PQ73_POLSC